MLLSFLRPKWAVSLGFAMLALSAHGQTSSSLRSAVEAAWALSPQAQSLVNRQAELDARSQAASSLISGPPQHFALAPQRPASQKWRAARV